jgi:putative FmdB family regulatory protein
VPFYDYICQKCGHEVEVMHSVHGQGPAACPKCGGPMKKALTAAAVHYKGSGWARKEKTSKPAKAAARSDSGSSSGSESGSPSGSGSSSGSGADPAPSSSD